jgi:hypothetical protein
MAASADINPLDLLRYLDDRVRAAAPPPGLRGSLSFGVVEGGVQLWWRVELASGATTTFASSRPSGCEAYVGMNGAGALALLGFGPSSAKVVQRVAGNQDLLARFATHYFPRPSQARGSKGGKP